MGEGGGGGGEGDRYQKKKKKDGNKKKTLQNTNGLRKRAMTLKRMVQKDLIAEKKRWE